MIKETEGMNFISADSDSVSYMGRVDFSDKKAPKIIYAGSNITLNFQGTSVGAVVNTIKGNQNVVSAPTSVVNSASSFAGVVKRDKKSKKTKK